jgi:hypothetical protein
LGGSLTSQQFAQIYNLVAGISDMVYKGLSILFAGVILAGLLFVVVFGIWFQGMVRK